MFVYVTLVNDDESKDESDDAKDTVDVNLVNDDDKQIYAHKKGDLL